MLKDNAAPSVQAVGVIKRHPVKEHGAGMGLHETKHRANQQTLPASVGAKHERAGSGPKVARNAVNQDAFRIGVAQD